MSIRLSQKPFLLLLFGLSTLDLAAQNDPPLVSDRPGVACGTFTLAPGRFQLEAGMGVEWTGAGRSTDNFVATPAVLRVGLLENFEFRLGTAGWMHASSQPLHEDGMGAPWVGFKYRARESEGAADGPAMAFLFHLDLPAGSATFRPPEAVPSLVFSIDQALSVNWSVNTNVGFAVPQDQAGERYSDVLYAVAFWRTLGAGTSLFLEFAGSTPQLDGAGSSALFDGGVTWLLNSDVQFDIALGRGVAGDSADWSVAGGIVVRLN